MSKTPQWAVDAAEDLVRFMEYSVESVAKRIAHHASKDPVRKLAGELAWMVLSPELDVLELKHEMVEVVNEWRYTARELKKVLER